MEPCFSCHGTRVAFVDDGNGRGHVQCLECRAATETLPEAQALAYLAAAAEVGCVKYRG